ncbi:MAG: ABC transporter ATP-binding protein [Planctomycetes bacterium]|nr:ABC transporter ATP-binding protein [Planctomycetota bacterium]
MTNAIEVRSLVKRFGDLTAVDHLDLDIPRGKLTSMLGPNGAGKTTTVRILTTLLAPCEGETVIGGFRLTEQNDQIKPLLGLVPQEIALYETLSARQNLRFFAKLYGYRGAEMDERVMKLLADVQLDDRADEAIETFSGGMQRRVNIAVALIHDPEIIFMDEPTVGLDPISRTAVWEIIEELKSRGKTIVLTTHYMEEAETLSDRVIIIDHGKVIVAGTPSELIQQTGVETVFRLTIDGDTEVCVEKLRELAGIIKADGVDGRLTVFSESDTAQLVQVIQTLPQTGATIQAVEVIGPNLGAVFLHFTGRELRD